MRMHRQNLENIADPSSLSLHSFIKIDFNKQLIKMISIKSLLFALFVVGASATSTTSTKAPTSLKSTKGPKLSKKTKGPSVSKLTRGPTFKSTKGPSSTKGPASWLY